MYEELGAQIVYFDLPALKYALPVYYILACAEDVYKRQASYGVIFFKDCACVSARPAPAEKTQIVTNSIRQISDIAVSYTHLIIYGCPNRVHFILVFKKPFFS